MPATTDGITVEQKFQRMAVLADALDHILSEIGTLITSGTDEDKEAALALIGVAHEFHTNERCSLVKTLAENDYIEPGGRNLARVMQREVYRR